MRDKVVVALVVVVVLLSTTTAVLAHQLDTLSIYNTEWQCERHNENEGTCTYDEYNNHYWID